MPFQEPTTAMLPVQDILAFSDVELAQFMQLHRRPNGDFELSVDGWDELSAEERSALAERLKYKTRVGLYIAPFNILSPLLIGHS